jgi:hypothetical protein
MTEARVRVNRSSGVVPSEAVLREQAFGLARPTSACNRHPALATAWSTMANGRG